MIIKTAKLLIKYILPICLNLIIFNKEKSSMKVRENTIFRERIEFSGCEQIK